MIKRLKLARLNYKIMSRFTNKIKDFNIFIGFIVNYIAVLVVSIPIIKSLKEGHIVNFLIFIAIITSVSILLLRLSQYLYWLWSSYDYLKICKYRLEMAFNVNKIPYYLVPLYIIRLINRLNNNYFRYRVHYIQNVVLCQITCRPMRHYCKNLQLDTEVFTWSNSDKDKMLYWLNGSHHRDFYHYATDDFTFEIYCEYITLSDDDYDVYITNQDEMLYSTRVINSRLSNIINIDCKLFEPSDDDFRNNIVRPVRLVKNLHNEDKYV